MRKDCAAIVIRFARGAQLKTWEEGMPFTPPPRGRPIEYFMLHDAKPIGRSVGLYANREISESVVDDFGRHYVFAGIAPRLWNGEFNVDALRTGEFILKPGLVYRLEYIPPSWLESFFR
jgi:hypothetical protein